MIIKFEKIENHYFVKEKQIMDQLSAGIGLWQFTWRDTSCNYDIMTPFDLYYMKKILKNKFKSVKFIHTLLRKNKNDNRFYFKDKADEAYFLLWSNGGVEI